MDLFDQADSIFDDDNYWINQREADDYRHEAIELDREEVIDDDGWDDNDDHADPFEYLPGDPDFDYDDRVND